jgi:hypothetical protein
MKAIVVPADPTQPTRIVDLNQGDEAPRQQQVTNLQREVGGHFDAQSHPEADLWFHDEGRLLDMPINVRVAHWQLNDARRGQTGLIGEGQLIYGDVVVTGPADDEGEITPVDEHLVSYFEELKLSKNAMSEWDIRSTDWSITSFDAWGSDAPGPDLGPDL